MVKKSDITSLNIVTLDFEVYPNALIVVLEDFKTKNRSTFVKTSTKNTIRNLKKYINKNTVVCGYNNLKYDNYILKWLFHNDFEVSNIDLYYLSKKLITEKIEESFKTKLFNFYSATKNVKYWQDSIDLMNIIGKRKSLKEYSASLGLKKLQELPFDPDSEINEGEVEELIKYCNVDVDTTIKLLDEHIKNVDLRMYLDSELTSIKAKVGFKQSLLPMSEPQIAQNYMGVLYSAEENLKYSDFQYVPNMPEYKNIELGKIIHQNISFQTKPLQDLLEKIKTLVLDFEEIEKETFTGSFKTIGITNKKEASIDFEFDELQYKFGLGGIHSITKNKTYTSDKKSVIVDIDFTSFYPALMINMELRPKSFKKSWNKIYKKLWESRIEAKAQGDKIVSDALKIILNSLYGKFNSKYFFGYDPKIAYTTTVNGQLIALMLIERLFLQDFKVISANTDGLTVLVKREKLELFRDTYKNFADEMNLKLDENIYSKIAFESVNDYVAKAQIIDKKGNVISEEIKRIGSFDCLKLKKSLNMAIVYESVEANIFEGTPIEHTILNCKELMKFAIVKKTDKKFDVFYGKNLSQHINRYVIAKPEYANELYYLNTMGNKAKLDYGDRAYLINDIPENFNFDVIDYDFYIKKAKEVITKITTNITVEKYKNKLMSDLKMLQSIGLPLAPKLFKDNIKGFKNTELKADWDFEKYPTLAAYTGYEAGVISIDIDYPEKLPDKMLKFLLNSGGITVWHDKRDTISDFNPKVNKRFKKIYAYKAKNLKSMNQLEKYGFEVHYSRVVNVAGAYDYESEYRFSGALTQLPKDFESHLLLYKAPRKRKTTDYTDNISDNFEEFESFIENYLSNLGLNYHTSSVNNEFLSGICSSDSATIYNTECFFKELHSSGNYSEMQILLDKKGKIRLLCFHESCKASLLDLAKEINKEFKAYSNKNINFENLHNAGLSKKEIGKYYDNYQL